MNYYKVPQQGYVAYDYTTSASTSPSPGDGYNYYVPQYGRSPGGSPGRTPTRHHVRTTSYQQPRVAQWGSPTGYPSAYYTVNPNYSSPPPPPARYEYVSTHDSHKKPSARRYSSSGHGHSGNATASPHGDKRRGSMRSTQKQRVYPDGATHIYGREYDSSLEELYNYPEPRVEPRIVRQTSTKKTRKADNFVHVSQTTTTHEVDTPTRSRATRRSSTNTRPIKPVQPVQPVKPVKPVKPPREATAEDATRHKVPAGYCLKNWDPTESPVLLLGSVFDANSLGKWIYDWTVFHHKAHSPLAEVAGELWLLLIKFAGKKKRAEECLPRIRGRDNRGMILDFLESGDRIWAKLKHLLKSCEEFMWHAAKKEGGSKGKVMGEKSGIEFVKSIFGRDRELERTEKLMTSIRLWNMRFDANCEEVLRKPRT